MVQRYAVNYRSKESIQPIRYISIPLRRRREDGKSIIPGLRTLSLLGRELNSGWEDNGRRRNGRQRTRFQKKGNLMGWKE
jgi:hypothetical protein